MLLVGEPRQARGQRPEVPEQGVHHRAGREVRPQLLDRALHQVVVEQGGPHRVRVELRPAGGRIGLDAQVAQVRRRGPVEVEAGQLGHLGVDPLHCLGGLAGQLPGHRVDQHLLEQPAGPVVRETAHQCGVTSQGDLRLAQTDVVLSDPHGELPAGRLPFAHRGRERPDERAVALEPGRLRPFGGDAGPGPARRALPVGPVRRVRPVPPARCGQFGAGRENGLALAERGQHMRNVVQEAGVGPQHQHAPLGGLREGVEHIGGAVQRDHRLPGAGTALDHGDAAVLGADDRVLLGLEGGHRGAHPAGAAGLERGRERAVADHVLRGGLGAVEQLVAHPDHGALRQPQVTAPAQAHRVHGCRLVERAGGVGPPVDQGGQLVLVALEAQPADPQRGAVRQVDPAEHQAALGSFEASHLPGELFGGQVPLVRLGGAVRLFGECPDEPGPGVGEPLVEQRDDGGHLRPLQLNLVYHVVLDLRQGSAPLGFGLSLCEDARGM